MKLPGEGVCVGASRHLPQPPGTGRPVGCVLQGCKELTPLSLQQAWWGHPACLPLPHHHGTRTCCCPGWEHGDLCCKAQPGLEEHLIHHPKPTRSRDALLHLNTLNFIRGGEKTPRFAQASAGRQSRGQWEPFSHSTTGERDLQRVNGIMSLPALLNPLGHRIGLVVNLLAGEGCWWPSGAGGGALPPPQPQCGGEGNELGKDGWKPA